MISNTPSVSQAAQPVTPIESAMIDLSAAQNDTHDLISNLFGRLNSVLPSADAKPVNGQIAGPANITGAGESPLHTALLERIEFARGHNKRLMKILDELTL
ncbi:MAG TPA: hypothetical protein VGE09_03350 [Pseudoxanthomonas sp.]